MSCTTYQNLHQCQSPKLKKENSDQRNLRDLHQYCVSGMHRCCKTNFHGKGHCRLQIRLPETRKCCFQLSQSNFLLDFGASYFKMFRLAYFCPSRNISVINLEKLMNFYDFMMCHSEYNCFASF